eukprot:270815-Rhodomonas_salina.1
MSARPGTASGPALGTFVLSVPAGTLSLSLSVSYLVMSWSLSLPVEAEKREKPGYPPGYSCIGYPGTRRRE